MFKNFFGEIFGKAESTTTTAPAAFQEKNPADLMTADQQESTLKRQFREREEAARGLDSAALQKKQKEAQERAGHWYEEAEANTDEKKAAKQREAAELWQKLSDKLAAMATEAAEKEAAEKKAAEKAAAEELARVQAMTPEQLAADPEAAQKKADHLNAEAKQLRKEARTANDKATAKEEEAAAARVDAARARQTAGEATEEDEVMITTAATDEEAAELVNSILDKVKGMFKEVRGLFGELLDVEYNLSQVTKRMRGADYWPIVAKIMDAAGVVGMKQKEFTPAIFSADSVHPYLLVATGQGLKVGTYSKKGAQVVKRWNVENVIKFAFTSQALKAANIPAEKIEKRRQLLADEEAARAALIEKRKQQEEARKQTEAARAELEKAADPKQTPEISVEELEAKQTAVQQAENAEQLAAAETAAAKQEAAAATDETAAADKEARQETRTATREADEAAKFGTLPREEARRAWKNAQQAQRRAVKKAREAGNEAEANEKAAASYLEMLFVARAAAALQISEEEARKQMKAAA